MILTRRALLLLLLAAPFVAAATWLPALEWLALAYAGLCLLLFGFDWVRARPVSAFEISRSHDSKLSLGADNVIRLAVRNRQPRPISFQIRDEPPEAFRIGQRILGGAVGPRATWEGSYTVHPLQRGDYAFGDLNLRWEGPLGLVIRQGTVPAAGPVKVYPNLLDVRRYDLLLRENRL